MFFVLGFALAQEELSTQALPVSIVPPALLNPQDKVSDHQGWHCPQPPKKGQDGTSLDVENDIDHCPAGAPVSNLADPQVLSQLQAFNDAERSGGKYQWQTFNSLDYCHFRDGDRDWYGWRKEDSFYWVLFRNGRFWWRDNFARRWLSFDKGYWWWQDEKKSPQVQVYLQDGHYHVCDKQGVLGEDLWTTGLKDVVTQPVPKEEDTPTSRPGSEHERGGPGMGMSSF